MHAEGEQLPCVMDSDVGPKLSLGPNRYFNAPVPFALTGAHAAVFVYLYVDLSISQSPPIGSFTSTVREL